MSMIGSSTSKTQEEVEYARKILSEAFGSPTLELRTAAFHAAQAIRGYKQGDNRYTITLAEPVPQEKPYSYQNDIRELKLTPFSISRKELPAVYVEVLVNKEASFEECVRAWEITQPEYHPNWSAVLVEPGRDDKEMGGKYIVKFDND